MNLNNKTNALDFLSEYSGLQRETIEHNYKWIVAAMEAWKKEVGNVWIEVKELPENKGERFLTIDSNGSYDICYVNEDSIWVSIYTGMQFTKSLTHYQKLTSPTKQ